MNNYKLIKKEFVEDVASEVEFYEHNKTKAQVLVLKNDDDNKTFGIGFKTIPSDSTGVAHIVEHCVLSGSRKYKTKEPFMDLIKSSMQTFLNAMTFPDKTIYPISSRNEKDFYNLMDVYLDSVFYPAMYKNRKIFEQEGWHYELDDKDGQLTYNGVVYNEMKGVYSDPQNTVSDSITFNLHKDSTYGVDSGGDPKHITDLTYENFLNFHETFYHPSNSYIYLYGDMDMDKALKYIDENYLSEFEYKDIDSSIKLNKGFKEQKFVESTYSASKEEIGENKDYLAYSWSIGLASDKLDLFMKNFLIELLVESNSAPIKKALLEKNLGEDVYAEGSSSLALDFSIVSKNIDSSRIDEFKICIEKTLKDIVENGIDKNLLEATLNKFEFAFREGGGTQRSILYYIRALNSWLYGACPIESLKGNDLIKDLRQKMKDGFLETYIEDKLLNNSFSTITKLSPELNKNKKEEEIIKNKLNEYKNSLDQKEVEKIIKDAKSLVEFQMGEDTKEDKDTIPSLDLKDIKESVTHIPKEITEDDGVTYIFNDQFTNEIAYTTMSFDTSHITKEEIKNIPILTSLIGKLSTEKYNYNDLDSEIYKVLGGLSFTPVSYVDLKKDDTFYPRLNLSLKTLDLNFEKSLDIISEIVENTKFDNKNRVKELLLMEKSANESIILQNGHMIMIETVKSYFSKQSAYNSEISGLESYFYLCDLLKDFDKKWDSLLSSLETLKKSIFNRNNLVVNYTASKDSFEKNKDFLKSFISKLDNAKYEKYEYLFKAEKKNQAFTTSSNVQYVSKGCRLKDFGLKYKGSFSVLSNILSSEYLHYNIRAKGGAYGAGSKLTLTSDIVTYSYRDPNLSKTIDVYDNMYKFIEDLDISEEELKNYIIGSMNTFDPLLSPAAKGSANFSRFMTNMTEEDLARYKKEAINTSLEELKSLSPIIKKAMDENYLCAIGGSDVIEANKDLFKEIISLRK